MWRGHCHRLQVEQRVVREGGRYQLPGYRRKLGGAERRERHGPGHGAARDQPGRSICCSAIYPRNDRPRVVPSKPWSRSRSVPVLESVFLYSPAAMREAQVGREARDQPLASLAWPGTSPKLPSGPAISPKLPSHGGTSHSRLSRDQPVGVGGVCSALSRRALGRGLHAKRNRDKCIPWSLDRAGVPAERLDQLPDQ
jgi:hypothetical protein